MTGKRKPVETLEDGNVIYWRPKHLLAQRQHPEA